jgi:hypothetical protein
MPFWKKLLVVLVALDHLRVSSVHFLPSRAAPADHGIHSVPWNESLPPGRRMPYSAPALDCMSAAIWLSSSHEVGALVQPAFAARSVR